jgi:hypothetical protein
MRAHVVGEFPSPLLYKAMIRNLGPVSNILFCFSVVQRFSALGHTHLEASRKTGA